MPICPKCREKNPALGAKCPRDGYYYIYESAVEEAKSDPRVGTLAADKYVILGLISEGGMGAVYRALQLPVEREVALKVLRAELQDSNKVRERFVQEARAVSRLSHPNIITLHDFGFEGERYPYMVMEFAPGQELSSWMWRDDMTTERLIHVMRQILSALAEAHQRNIVHRDLKPENVIITRAGGDEDFPKLLDFGIARLINEEVTRGLTGDGEVFGTPHYMSPEQAQGKRGIGPASDVYALGVMFYEFFTGKPPFDAEAPLSVLFMHINDPMPEIFPRRGLTLPEGVVEVVEKATRKAAEERYADAGEMLRALDDALGLNSAGRGYRSTAPLNRAPVNGDQASAGRESSAPAAQHGESPPTTQQSFAGPAQTTGPLDDGWEAKRRVNVAGLGDLEGVAADEEKEEELSAEESRPSIMGETVDLRPPETVVTKRSASSKLLLSGAAALVLLFVGAIVGATFLGGGGADGERPIQATESVDESAVAAAIVEQGIEAAQEALVEEVEPAEPVQEEPELESESEFAASGDAVEVVAEEEPTQRVRRRAPVVTRQAAPAVVEQETQANAEPEEPDEPDEPEVLIPVRFDRMGDEPPRFDQHEP